MIVRTALAAAALVAIAGLVTSTPAGAIAMAGLSSCTLTLNTAGSMAMLYDGKTLASDAGGGSAAVMLLSALNMRPQIILSAPTPMGPAGWSSSPTAMLSVDTTSGVHTGYSSGALSVNTGALADMLTINARVVSPTGFKSGSYSVATTLTCQAA